MPTRKPLTIERIRKQPHYKKLMAIINRRAQSGKVNAGEAAAHTYTDLRHACDELGVDFAVVSRIGGQYYMAEIHQIIR